MWGILLIPAIVAGFCVLLWVLYALEKGLPQEPDTHQHYLNDYHYLLKGNDQ